MNLSRYTKIFPSAQGDGSQVLFSTANASAVLVPSGLIADIESGRLSPEERESLGSLGLVTDDPEREKQEMLGYIGELNALRYVGPDHPGPQPRLQSRLHLLLRRPKKREMVPVRRDRRRIHCLRQEAGT